LTAGQTAGGISDILPVGEIMRKLIAEAEAALSKMQSRGDQAAHSRPKPMPETHSSPSLAALQEVPEPDSLGG
jgi:hypothetical protein